jgi:mannose-6-phosphate isomerase-like protein (cupin superfamily)
MSERIRQIAMRIRELREIAGMPADLLAEELQIGKAVYREYESGESDIPVSVLLDIAKKFKVDLTEILTGGAPHLHEYCLVRKGKGVTVEREKSYEYQSLAYNYIRKKAEPFLVTVPPESDDAPVPANSHPGQEFYYLLEGTMKVVINKHELVMYEGDSLFFDATFAHGMKTVGSRPAKFVALII